MMQQQQPIIITTPTANDVLCGRGKSYNNHSGNIQFISIVKDHVQTYVNLSSRFEKTLLVRNLVHKLTNEIGTRFLRKSTTSTTTSSTSTSTSTSSWYPLNEEESYTKVGHAIRDMIKLNRKKSNASNKNNKSSQAIKKMKQQTTPTTTTTATTAPVICFEPIQCHSTENLIDHCITTRALSLKTSDLLTSILNVVQTTTTEEEEEEDQDDFEMIMMAAEAATPPPPQLARFVSDESSSCNVFPPPILSSSSSSDRRSPSFCVVKAFGLDLIDSDEDECYSNLIMNDDDDTFFQF